MAKATIKASSGAIITVEGTQEEVAKIISSYEKTSVVGQAKEAIARTKSIKNKAKRQEGASDLLIGLREAGFFAKPKTLAEMSDALEEKGYLYPTTTLSGVVLGLVKRKELRRKKMEGRWVYGK
jgi:hypothetical protein